MLGRAAIVAVLWTTALVSLTSTTAGSVRGAATTPVPASADTWVVIVSTSRFWYNYRHESNALSIYRSVKRLGVHDSNIILMLAEDFACDPRNKYSATVYNNGARAIDVYGGDIEVDYRGAEVTPSNFIRLLTGRHEPGTPMSKRLLTGEHSTVLLYMTGHGGEDFLKFQDSELISSAELGDCFEQMHQQRRYNELLFIIDTCHAASMLSGIHSPSIVGMASSARTEDSYSVDVSSDLGVYMIDAFTGRLLQFLEGVAPGSNATVAQMFNFANKPHAVRSHPELVASSPRRPPSKMRIADFFGNQITAWFDVEDAGGTGRSAAPPVPVPVMERWQDGGCGGGGQREREAAATVWHPTTATPASLGMANRRWLVEFCAGEAQEEEAGVAATAAAAEAAVFAVFPRASVHRRRRRQIGAAADRTVKLFRVVDGGEERLVWSGHPQHAAITEHGWPALPELQRVLRRLEPGVGAPGVPAERMMVGATVLVLGIVTSVVIGLCDAHA